MPLPHAGANRTFWLRGFTATSRMSYTPFSKPSGSLRVFQSLPDKV